MPEALIRSDYPEVLFDSTGRHCDSSLELRTSLGTGVWDGVAGRTPDRAVGHHLDRPRPLGPGALADQPPAEGDRPRPPRRDRGRDLPGMWRGLVEGIGEDAMPGLPLARTGGGGSLRSGPGSGRLAAPAA